MLNEAADKANDHDWRIVVYGSGGDRTRGVRLSEDY